MIPNLSLATADDIALATQIMRALPEEIDPLIAGTFTDAERRALARYSLRTPTIAIRTSNAALVHGGLLAGCLATAQDADDRDVMIQLALHYVVAQLLGLSPVAVFGQVADRLPGGWLPKLLREFGNRQDITLKAFGWQELTTPEGPDFASIMT